MNPPAPHPRRWRGGTVKLRIYVGISVIVVLGVLAMLYVYRGLDDVAGYLAQLEKVDAPFSINAIEMEKNAGEYALGVLQYVERPDAGTRADARSDAADFKRYHDGYMRLSSDARKRELGDHLSADFTKLTATGDALMAKRDQTDAVFGLVTDALEAIDRIADDHMMALAARDEPLHSRTTSAIANIEAEAAEVGFWLATFQQRATTLTVTRLHEKMAELDGAIADYRALPLSVGEQKLAGEVTAQRDKIKDGIANLLADHDALKVMVKEFVRLQTHIDDVSDEEIEPLAVKGLTEPQELADQTAVRVLTSLRYAIPLYLLIALAVGALLILSIIYPLRKLSHGARAIGTGDLEYRIATQGVSEFDDVAQQFNTMVDRLQQSTVSRRLLEVSEQNLQATVAELHEEIAERLSSERERDKLQAELRHSEAMAAMGSLMAGVAHEVRNPLFGISSTLDAMEATTPSGEREQRYRDTLRREVTRLNKLMHDLLEYGRPPSNDFAEERLNKLIAEAIHVCTPAATAAGVSLRDDARFDGKLAMNRSRLLQVFVNLLENAVHFAPRGSEVVVSVQEIAGPDGRGWVECRVEDQGPGFDAADLPHLFEPFYTRRRRGTGLGLAIVQRIIDEHRGRIEPSNRPNGGACMTVRLPLVV